MINSKYKVINNKLLKKGKTYQWLITGVAGFIGSRTAELLLNNNSYVIGIDNLNDYYDVRIKRYRLNNLNKNKNFSFYKTDIENLNEKNKKRNKTRIRIFKMIKMEKFLAQSMRNKKTKTLKPA